MTAVQLCNDDGWRQQMSALRKDELNWDMLFQLGEVKMTAHRVILAQHSPYWSRVIAAEQPKPDKMEVTMDHDPAAFDQFLEFCYSGRVNMALEVVPKVHMLAHKYEMAALQQLCEDYMAGGVTKASCVEFFCHASQYSLPSLSALRQAALAHIRQHFGAVSQTPRFLRLSVEQLCTFLDDTEVVASEDERLDAALAWLAHDGERQALAARVLWHIRFAFLEAQTLVNLQAKVGASVSLLADEVLGATYVEALRVQYSGACKLELQEPAGEAKQAIAAEAKHGSLPPPEPRAPHPLRLQPRKGAPSRAGASWDSKILDQAMRGDLAKMLPGADANTELKLLYRGSRDGFTVPRAAVVLMWYLLRLFIV